MTFLNSEATISPMEREVSPANPVWLRKYPIVKISRWAGGYERDPRTRVIIFGNQENGFRECLPPHRNDNGRHKTIVGFKEGNSPLSSTKKLETNLDEFGDAIIGTKESRIKFPNSHKATLQRYLGEAHAAFGVDRNWQDGEETIDSVNDIRKMTATKFNEYIYREISNPDTLAEYVRTLNVIYSNHCPEIRIVTKVFPGNEKNTVFKK